MSHTYHAWEANGKRYRAVYDEDYTPYGNYALETEEETNAAVADEAHKLGNGVYVALGVIVTERRPHCPNCKCPQTEWSWTETDSLWGIVVENSHAAIEAFVKEGM